MRVKESKKMSELSAGVRNAAKTHKLLAAELVTLSPNPEGLPNGSQSPQVTCRVCYPLSKPRRPPERKPVTDVPVSVEDVF
jgi:hypothetical protein